MVLPAMADGLDLSGYHLIDENTPDLTCDTTTATDFETGSVTMKPLYIKQCAPGTYLDVDGKEVSNIDETTGDELDYYYVNACTTGCGVGYYCPGVDTPSLTSGGILETSGQFSCATETQGAYPDSVEGENASINDCYKTCSASDITETEKQNAHATTMGVATEQAFYGNECFYTIPAGGCETGFARIILNDLYTNLDNDQESWSVVNTSDSEKELRISGTMAHNGTSCIATVTSVKFGDNVRTETFQINIGTDCLESDESATALMEGVVKHYTNNINTDATFCLANTVNIDWKEVANPGVAATCTYGGTLTLPDAPKHPTEPNNYEFIGWTVGKVETTTEP